MRTAVVVGLVAFSAVAAPVPKALKRPSDADQLQGRWVSVSIDGGAGHNPDPGYWLEFDGGRLSIGTTNKLAHTKDAPFTLDPSKTPKHIDFTSGSRTRTWVYEIDGDTFTWCHPASGVDRPTGLKSEKPYCCTIWKRVKE